MKALSILLVTLLLVLSFWFQLKLWENPEKTDREILLEIFMEKK